MLLATLLFTVIFAANLCGTGESSGIVSCQLDMAALNAAIDKRISLAQQKEPYLQSFQLRVTPILNRKTLQLKGPNETILASVSLKNPSLSATSSNKILAYRPKYKDFHKSGLAGIFVNIKKVFPCLNKIKGNYQPSCTIVTDEEDGFNKGKAIIELGDMGNNVQVFSAVRNVPTYALAIQRCPKMTSKCLPLNFETKVMCFLPRSVCP